MEKKTVETFVEGAVRVQALGKFLARVEVRGRAGFEDRETFTVENREMEPAGAVCERRGGGMEVATEHWRVVVPEGASGLEGIRVETASGKMLCEPTNAMLAKKYLPSPSALPSVWVLGDAPRAVPPPWGALPPPEGMEGSTSGWDLENDAPDAYVFFPSASGYLKFREDYLRLTGGVPMVPLHALGLWYCRYHAYGEESALEVVDRFRAAGMPLDVFVVDTDWRVGASSGYEINEQLFPDMERFARRAHEKGVRVMLNDHPEPKGKGALDPAELRYRRAGLVSLLEKGVDAWWFDRNWHTHLQEPARGLSKEAWGMRLYWDVAKAHRPERRPLILSNADGINNGRLDGPSHPAAHRFPVWWTGDTWADWFHLRMGVENGVTSGVRSLLPYVHEDLGGHHGQPGEELYVRFMQYGAFSPVARIHCTTNAHRYPWKYGVEAEKIVGEYFRLRYRLLPTLYAAAAEAGRTGEPLMRRCDLEWPDRPEAADATQYALGEDLLVAPIVEPAGEGGVAERTIWIPPGEWEDLWTGETRRGPATIGAKCGLGEYPLHARRGGLIFTVPRRETTGEAVWPELVVDAYAREGGGETKRTLYEDDGWSTAWERGERAATEFRLAGTAEGWRLDAKPLPGGDAVRPRRRTTTVRFHLPKGAGEGTIWVDGREAEEGTWRWLPPSGRRAERLFAGRGDLPPPKAGPVAEWTGEWEAGSEIRVEIRGARGKA